jgi:hypothetical protein
MPITLLLTAVPAIYLHKDDPDEHTFIAAPFGTRLGLSMHSVKDLRSIKSAIGNFAEQIRRQFPDHSFTVLVRVRDGDTPPSGFGQALRSGALGQHRFATIINGLAPDQDTTHNFQIPVPPAADDLNHDDLLIFSHINSGTIPAAGQRIS